MNKALKKILYVEDDSDIAAIAKIALESMGGFTLCVCNSGQQALREVEKFEPDLIMIDVMMPDMDGTMTLKALREIPGVKDIPVVFITSKSQSHEIKNYLSLGVLSIITKPFDPITLAKSIENIWNKRHDQ